MNTNTEIVVIPLEYDTPRTRTNALEIIPQGDHWQVIPPPRPLTLEERLQRLIDLCDRSAKLADEIAASLNK
jgi:hypothetical protein